MLYTAKGGVRNLDVVDEARLFEKYGIHGGRAYAGMAALRGDPSDGLPGVPGIGEKTAAALLGRAGDYDGLMRALADDDQDVLGNSRTKLLAASDYLDGRRPGGGRRPGHPDPRAGLHPPPRAGRPAGAARPRPPLGAVQQRRAGAAVDRLDRGLSDVARDWDLRGDELAAAAIAAGEPTAWFDRLYTEGEQGAVSMPWDREEPHPLLREWADARGLVGQGRTAVVVGCGLGADAEYLARLGFVTTAFDVAPTAVRLAAERHPDSAVDYRVADLLALPAAVAPVPSTSWSRCSPCRRCRSRPGPRRSGPSAALVAPGGTLLAVAFRPTAGDDPAAGPPFALTREVMEQFAVDGVQVERAEELGDRWRVEYRRPAAA